MRTDGASDRVVDLIVAGAGITGLAATRSAVAAGLRVIVLEGRDRVGGRLVSVPTADGGSVDLGATWFWPGERRVAAMVRDLGVRIHDQYLAGDAMFEVPDRASRVTGNPIDVPSFRFTDGADALPVAIVAGLPTGTVKLGMPVSAVGLVDGVAVVTVGDTEFRAQSVILAMPPALTLERIAFSPALPDPFVSAARMTPVWMGATTKVVAVYDRPFWRDAGQSGSAVSHVGPMREIHDMSGPDGSPAALFGFVPDGSVPERDTVIGQLVKLFGPSAAATVDLHIHPWRSESLTSPPGVERLTAYQMFGHPTLRAPLYGGRLAFASTETGSVNPGHMEGALEAAEHALATMQAHVTTKGTSR